MNYVKIALLVLQLLRWLVRRAEEKRQLKRVEAEVMEGALSHVRRKMDAVRRANADDSLPDPYQRD